MQTIYVVVDNKRLRIDVSVAPFVEHFDPGTIVMVDCVKEIVESDASDSEDESVKHPAIVVGTEENGKVPICWLLLSQDSTDIDLPKAKWPAWKQRNVHVLDTSPEVVPATTVERHPSPDALTLAARCYDSKQKAVASISYTTFMINASKA
jgi:hypothetical protein